MRVRWWWALAVLAVSCAHSGREFDFRTAETLKPGVSTRADAEAMLGPPAVVTVPGDGLTYCGWMYMRAGFAGSGAGSKHLTLRFRPDGLFDGIAGESASGVYAAQAREPPNAAPRKQ
jgi:hypothetical protein